MRNHILTEGEIQAAIRIDLGRDPTVRITRNSRGSAWHGTVRSKTQHTIILDHPRYVDFGLLIPGSSDLIGMRQVLITPDMVGTTVAIFTAIEVKRPGAATAAEQTIFISSVKEFGGIAGIARSAEDARAIVSYRQGGNSGAIPAV
jgi:hypothetical protein